MGDRETTLATLDRAGIEPAGSFAEFLTRMAERARAQLDDTPEIAEIRGEEDYRYVKRALAALRKVSREADETRRSITCQLDEAKRAVMGFTADSVRPVSEAVERMAALKAAYEDEGRAAKRARLEAYWEETYPALALCREADEPLVPFSRIEDADWTRRVSELGRDESPRADMDALAHRLADGERTIDSLDAPDHLKASAKARLFDTLDPVGAIAGIDAERRRLRDVERLEEARRAAAGQPEPEPLVPAPAAPEPAPTAPEPERAAETAPEPPAVRTRWDLSLSLPCEPGAARVLCVWCDSDDELAAAVAAMKAAGLHGCVGKAVA